MKLLYCFDSGNAFFAKNYRYVKPRTRLNPDNIQVFDNADGFFNDLPPLLPNEMKGRHLRMSKQDKEILQLKVYEAKQASLNSKINRLRSRMEKASEQEQQAQ